MYHKHLLLLLIASQVVLSQQVPLAGNITEQPRDYPPSPQQTLPEQIVSQQNVPNEVVQPSSPSPASEPETDPNVSSTSGLQESSPTPPMTGSIATSGDQIEANLIPDAAHNVTIIEASPVGESALGMPAGNDNQVVDLSFKQVAPLETAATQAVAEEAPKTEVANEPAPSEKANSAADGPSVNVSGPGKNDTAVTNNSQIELNSIPDVRPSNNKTIDTGLDEEELNNPHFSYKLDYDSCGPVLPLPIMNMSINRILSTINGENCTKQQDLKLLPRTNKHIRDRVMEVSAMPIELSQLFGAISTTIKCSSKPEKYEEDGKPKVRFTLKFELDLGDQKLRSRWRHYPRFQNDEIPLGIFDSGIRNKGKAIQTTSTKCQRFRIDTGDFYLELLSFRTSLEIQVSLDRIDETAYAISRHLGGQIHVANFTVDKLYLDHKLHISPISVDKAVGLNRMSNNKLTGHSLSSLSSTSHNALAPTVQIFHDQNNHHRRNNWLLDMYGNWLRHEYKAQLGGLLGKPLVDGLNSCFLVY